MIFDSHAHYNDEAFEEDRDEVLAQMGPGGGSVTAIANMGAAWKDVEDSLLLAERYPYIYAAVGIHPDNVGELTDERMQKMYEYCRLPKTIAVGEIGLDYYWDKEPHEIQREWFIRQLQMAKDVNLPVNIHSRDAAQETFEIMKTEHAGTTGGIIHCFSSSAQMAMEYVKMGYYIGIGGVVTFKNARVMKEVAAAVPLDRIVVETDCPYLAPVPYRGKRNCSLYLPHVLEEIAKIKELTTEEVEDAIYQNTLKIYRKALG